MSDNRVRVSSGTGIALIGVVITIIMWGTLASSVHLLEGVPILFINGVALTLGGLLGLPWAKEWRMPLPVLVIGALVMFAYHVIYFYALQIGEPIGVSLVHYLWPMLIVLLAPRMSATDAGPYRHFTCGALGLGGAVLACLSANSLSVGVGATPDKPVFLTMFAYALGLLSAFLWAGYSLLGTRNKELSSHSVGPFCLIGGLACLALYFTTGSLPKLSENQYVLLLYLGLGPMGAAFYLWDYGMKRGDPRKIAILSYAIPILSTFALCLSLSVHMPILMWVGTFMVTSSVAISSRSK